VEDPRPAADGSDARADRELVVRASRRLLAHLQTGALGDAEALCRAIAREDPGADAFTGRVKDIIDGGPRARNDEAGRWRRDLLGLLSILSLAVSLFWLAGRAPSHPRDPAAPATLTQLAPARPR
jgi:hypothetical protein